MRIVWVFALDGGAPTPLVASMNVLGVAIAADANGAFMGDFYSGDLYRLW